MSCNCGKPKCDGKCGISPAVLQINNNDCTLFHRVEIPAAMGDEKTNPPKTGAYRNVLLYYAASGNSYLYSSDGIPTKLTGVVSDYEVLLNKPWINGVELIGNKTLADLGIISAIDTAVAAEATARANADNALSSRISTNTGKINTNTTAIANEKTARENADTALQNNISAESQARIDADAGLQSQINSTSGAVAAERDARILADNALGTRIDNVSGSVTNEENARIDADAGLQDQIDAVRSTAESALTPDDIDYTVMTDVDVSANTSTSAVNLDGSKVNLKTGTTSSKIISLPVASSTQAGVMNSSTFDAISSNTNNIQAILNGAVAVDGLPANPTQAQLTTAWQNETGLSTLINRASIYDVANSKVWTYYTNDSTWHAAANSSQVTVNTFTNSSEGLIKGSTNVGQVFAESDGTGSVNGWDALSDAVNDATTKLAGIQNGAEQNVQSDWNVTDTSSDAYIKNKPTIPTVNNGTLTIQKNGASVGTFTANQSGNSTANITVPTKTSDISNDSGFITASDIPAINNGTLTIQKNGANVQTFTANSATNKTANIEVPTKTSELDNDAGFIANDTHQVCGEGGNITLDTTTFEPLEMNHFGGNTEQQAYTGKNIINYITGLISSGGGITNTINSDGTITTAGKPNGDYNRIIGYYDLTPYLEDGATYTLSSTLYDKKTFAQVHRTKISDSSVFNYDTNTSAKTFTVDKSQYVYRMGIMTNTMAQWGDASLTITKGYQLEKSATATSFEPYVGGVPAPNPDYPQDVKTVTGENTVEICGRNLIGCSLAQLKAWNNGGTWSGDVYTHKGITYTPVFSNGALEKVIANGTSNSNPSDFVVYKVSASYFLENFEQNTQYTISAFTRQNGYTGSGYIRLASDPWSNVLTNELNKNSTSRNIDISSSNYTNMIVHFGFDNGVTVNNLEMYPQLVKGTEIGEYESYRQQSYEVNLGKNLYNGANYQQGFLGSDGDVASANESVTCTDYIEVQPSTSYTLSSVVVSGTMIRGICYYTGAKAFISRSSGAYGDTYSFTTPNNAKFVRFYWYNSNGLSLANFPSYVSDIQLEKGSTATSYAAYFTPIELCKIGDYQDYIYPSDGKWYVHKETASVDFGTLTWTVSTGSIYGTTGCTGIKYAPNNQTVVPSYAEKYIGRQGSGLSNYTNYYAIDTNKVNVQKGTASAPNPTGMFYYPLATPTDTEITNESLVAQLEALWRADGYDGQTHITALYADGNAQMQLAVCQYPSHLPIATTSQLGAVIVGDGLQIEPDGRLDVIVDDELSTTSRNPVQNAVVTEALAGKANNADLSAVATTGSFNDLVDQPTIPTVNNATLTIQKNGTNVATFTANSSTNATANITVPNITLTDVDPGEGGTLAANNFIGVYV